MTKVLCNTVHQLGIDKNECIHKQPSVPQIYKESLQIIKKYEQP